MVRASPLEFIEFAFRAQGLGFRALGFWGLRFRAWAAVDVGI